MIEYTYTCKKRCLSPVMLIPWRYSMKIKKGFVLEKVGDSYLACATGKLAREFKGLVRLNETGAFLWEKLSSSDKSEEDLARAILEEYDTTADVAQRDVKLFVENLTRVGIIE